MSSWAMVAVVAIIVWGIVQLRKSQDRADGKSFADERGTDQPGIDQRDPATEREIEQLRERIAVLERIATDTNSVDARETRRIAEEIEHLRDNGAD